jgi:hypothetical protein
MRAVSTMPKVVDLSQRGTTEPRRWCSIKRSPEAMFHQQQSLIYTLQQRSNELREKLHAIATAAPTKRSRVHEPARLVML